MTSLTQFPKGLKRLYTRNGSTLRYYFHPASTQDRNAPTLCFIPGFRSSAFLSLKSEFLLSLCTKQGYSFLTWDHASQGESIAADSNNVSVNLWHQDALDVLQEASRGKLLLVGASMGAWISLLIANRGPTAITNRLLGIVGIGAGINFTEDWLNNEVPVVDPLYIWKRPTQYHTSGYYEISVKMLLDSRECLMQDDEISVPCPVTFVHGRQDMDSKIDDILAFAKKVQGATVDIIDDGNHRLSKDSELALIESAIIRLVKETEKNSMQNR
jgi:pimeloyl-ACP methyl ester carboxylesterase